MTDAIVNTLVDAAELVPTLAADYRLEPPIQCELIRRGFNDTYLVMVGDGKYVLRLYFNGKYYIAAPDDFRAELDLLTFLHEQGVPVARPIPREDGSPLGWVETPGGPRACALFAFADGESVRDPTVDQARTLGDAVARLHLAADRYPSPYSRYHLDLRYLSERPMRLMEDHLRAQGREGLEKYRPAVAALETRVRSIPTGRGAYGIIHGDLHRGNYHFNAAGSVTLFDFDHGGYGWRAYDLATCQGQLKEAGGAFLEAYERLRPLSEVERESFGAFRHLRPIWDKGDVLATVAAWGEGSLDSDFADGITAMFEKLFPLADAA